MTFTVNLLTLFPQMFPGPLETSVLGNALRKGLFQVSAWQIKDFAKDKHKTVDDTPYGGGNGMVMKADILGEAIEKCFLDNDYPIVYLTPRGRVLNQQIAHEYAALKGVNVLCGRFEGVDERVLLRYKIQEVSVGDYVLSSGDVAAYSFLDAILRVVPGVLEEGEALLEESFAVGSDYQNLLEYPQYTRPFEWQGLQVPEVLLSGNHAEIKKWRFRQAIEKTRAVRPELLDQCRSLKGEKK